MKIWQVLINGSVILKGDGMYCLQYRGNGHYFKTLEGLMAYYHQRFGKPKRSRFFRWMMARYLCEDSPAGDLAKDMYSDDEFPVTDSRREILCHLHGACKECLEVFERCWKEYQHERTDD